MDKGGDPMVKPSKEQVMLQKMKRSSVDVRKTEEKAKSHSSSEDEACVIIEKGCHPIEGSSKDKVMRAKMKQLMRAKMKRSSVDVRTSVAAKAISDSGIGDETCVFNDKGGDPMERLNIVQEMPGKMKRSIADARKMTTKAKLHSGSGAETSVFMDKSGDPMERSSKEIKRCSVGGRKKAAKGKLQSHSGAETCVVTDKCGKPTERSSKEKVTPGKMNCCSVDEGKAKLKSRSGGGDSIERSSKEKVIAAKMNCCSANATKLATKAKLQSCRGGGDPIERSSKEHPIPVKMKGSTVDARKTSAKVNSQCRCGDKGGDSMKRLTKEQVMPAKMKSSTVVARKTAAKEKSQSRMGGDDPMVKLSTEQAMPAKIKRSTGDARKTTAKAKSQSRNGGGQPKEMSSKEMKRSTVNARKKAVKLKGILQSPIGDDNPMEKSSKEQVRRTKIDRRTVVARKTSVKAKGKAKLKPRSGGKHRCGSSEDSCSVNVVKEKLTSGIKIGNMVDVEGVAYGVNLWKKLVSEEYGCKKCCHCDCTSKSSAENVLKSQSDHLRSPLRDTAAVKVGISSLVSPPQIHNISSDSENENEELPRDDDESEFVSESSDDCSSDVDFYPNKTSKSSRSKKSVRSPVFDQKEIDLEEIEGQGESESEHSESSDEKDDHIFSDGDYYPNKSSKSFRSEKSGPSKVFDRKKEIEDESEHSESAHEKDDDWIELSESTHGKDEKDSSRDEDFHPNIACNDFVSPNRIGKKSIKKVKEIDNKERTRPIKVDIRNDVKRFKGGWMKRLPEFNNSVPTKMAERLRSSQSKKRKNSERETCVITLDDDDDEQEIEASVCKDRESDIEKTNTQKIVHEEKDNESKDSEQSDSSSNDNKEDDWNGMHQLPLKKRLVDKILVDSLWDQVDLLSTPCHEQELTLCKNFTLEDYNAKPAEEKSYWDIEGDKLFDEMYREMDFENAIEKIGSAPSNMVNDQTPINYHEGSGMLRNCGHGKHLLVLDEQIGIVCKRCSYVEMEIRYVPPTFVANPWRRTNMKEFREKRNNIDMDQLRQMAFENGRSHPDEDIVDPAGTVWGLIPGMRPTMYSHQRDGFEFIWNNLEGNIHLDVLKKETSDGGNGCIISHAPGTGKTRLTIMFIKSYLELYPTRKVVIIAPCNMLLTWEDEFKKWKVNIPFHNLNRPEFSGQEAKEAVNLIRHFREQDKDSNRLVKILSWKKDTSVLGMSYRLFEKLAGDYGNKKDPQNQIDRMKLKVMLQKLPDLLVLDEGHTPRNKKSLIWKALSGVETQKRIILSGTPFQNNFNELYNTLCLVRPKFADKFFVEKEHATSGKQNKPLNKWVSLTKGVEENNDDRIDEMRKIIYRMAHVYKGDILKEKLPGLRDSLIVLKPTKLQNTILNDILKMKNGLTREHGLSLTTVHPSLLIHSELKEKQQLSVYMSQLEDLNLNPEVGVKTKFIIELIRLSDSLNEKVLIFSQFIPPLTLIKDQLKSYFGWSVGNEILCMDGGKDTKMRQLSITSFNKSDNKAKVMLASTKACSEGISLVGASRVVLLDVVWNPSVERQAISRAYRLGQKKLVYIYHLVAGESETTKYSRQTQKDRLSKLVFSSSNDNNADTSKKILMGTIGEDKILQVMVQHEKTCLMFEKIINLGKDSSLIDADDVFGCAISD